MFTTITEEQNKQALVQAIIMREHEINQYQININNYCAMLAAMPTDWSAELEPYKTCSDEAIPDALFLAVQTMRFKDQVQKSVRSELVEQNKSQQVYDALISQFDPDELISLLAAQISAP